MSGEEQPPPSTRRKAQAAVPFVAASGALSLAMSLLSLLLLVRYLPQHEYGVWVLLTGLATPVGLFSSLGFQQSLLRFLPTLPDGPGRGEYFWAIFGRRLTFALCASLVLAATFPWTAPRFGLEQHGAAFLAVLPGTVLICGTLYATAGLHAVFRQREIFLASATQQLLFLATVGAGILTRQPLLYFAVNHSLLAAVHFAVCLGYCLRFFGRPRLCSLLRRRAEDRDERRYRWAAYLDDVAQNFLSADVSRYLLAAFSTTAQVASYALASTLAGRLGSFQPLEVFGSLARVSVFERFAHDDRIEALNRTFRFLYAANHLVSVIYLALFLPVGAELLAFVFREEYATAYLPALFLFVAMALFGMPVGLLAYTLRRPQYLIYAKVAVLVHVGLGIPLGMRYGASGMAFAAMASALLRNVVTYVLLRLEFEVRFPWSTFLRFVLAGAAAAAVTFGVRNAAPLAVALVAGCLVYAVAARLLRVMDPSERSLMVSLLPERVQGAARLLVGT